MRIPRWAWAAFALAVALLLIPIVGLLIRTPWARLPQLLASERALDAILLSLTTSTAAVGLVLVLGVPAALVLARGRGRWAHWCRTGFAIPMALPPVVAGLALLLTLGRKGLIGQPLSALGIEIGFTTVAVILAQTFVALPFLVLTVEGAMRSSGTGQELAAAHLGATPTRVLFTVTLPRLAPAIVSGLVLAFARALGEFGATLTFAGSLQGVTRTLPLEIYLLRESDSDLALALAAILVIVAVGLMGAANRMRGVND
ncbi:ABC transporter permease [Tessaracoccus sp. OH4464_COT-324]|uniref:ABC transporter permease n=1 Tax=Tessaracoccus sp. OH4464_COT-324 TaxID=2491059 RepID=UPI000F643B2C|nr:ABC transporter permease [Tessaracoccus sp. OH4464_COT-324]RRD46636.1 molybdate ABC transporter permease subunit [Tessaracoccus sp. OH4464_COT-324]